MTDARLRDPLKNFAYYADEAGTRYERNASRFVEQRVSWAASRLRHAGRVLDLGANDGFLAELLPERTEYHGIELSTTAITHAWPRASGRLVLGNIVTFDYSGLAPFDAVVCMEVLEHLPDPEAFLRRIIPVVKPRGFVLTTSAMGQDEHDEPGNMEHLREWNPRQFRELHERAGFIVVEVAALEVYKTPEGSRMTTGIIATPRW